MSASEQRLLDAWLAPQGAGIPVACLATTFSFDPVFFEEECLARFLGLDSTVLPDSSAADAAYYVVQREQALEEVHATVLVDRGAAAAPTSHRWDVIATGAPPGGVQHAKVSVLLWEHATRVIVASANLTTSGYRDNIEVCWTFDRPGEMPVSPIYAAVAGFLRELLDRHTAGERGADSPLGRAMATVAELAARADASDGPRPSRGLERLAVVHTLSDRPLLDQAFAACWNGSAPRELSVVSPYFVSISGTERRTDGLDAVRARLSPRGPVRTTVAVTAVELADSQIRIEAPAEVRTSAGRGELLVRLWRRAGVHADRHLHAKVLRFSREDWTMLVAGSANCTGAGLGLPGATRNVELAVAVGARPSSSVGTAIKRWLPPLENLPSGAKLWEQPPAEEEDGASADRLPEKFREALWHPARDLVVIELGPEAEPSSWAILDGAHPRFTSEADGSARKLSLEVRGQAPPLALTVEWRRQDGEVRTAELVVGVADRRALPDPPELQDLTFDELLELLAAGSRFRAAMRRVLRRRGRATTADVVDLDPHARVDTSGFVLQRMRRAGRALEGLREQLERPVAYEDTVARRLHSRVFSPTALGRQLDLEAAKGTVGAREHAFLVAELVLCLRRAEWRVIGDEVEAEWCRAEAAKLAAALAGRIEVEDPAIAGYLARTQETS